MNYNECILLTIKIKDDLQKSINTIRHRGFKKTGNPSFRIFDNSLILGLYDGDKLPPNIKLPNKDIIITKRVNLVDDILYYSIEEDFPLLEDKLIKNVALNKYNNKYFPLSTIVNKGLNPLIYIANNIKSNPCSYNLNKSFIINDFKIELIKVQLEDRGITYSTIDYRHLQNNIV